MASAKYASTLWGTSQTDPSEASTPTSTIPVVCDNVTKTPRITASIGLPRAPTIYAAAIVLPCPGVAACTAPTQKLDRT